MNKLSLFSGIGGDDLASEWAGIETICFVEKDKYCQKVLRKHWPDIPIIEDVKDVTKETICNTICEPRWEKTEDRLGMAGELLQKTQWGENTNRFTTSSPERIDIISGGFPCQPHSVAGKRQGSSDERNLWPEFRRVIGIFKPRWVVAENVPGIFASDGGLFFNGILCDLAALGYAVGWCTFGAVDVGALHRRDRVFIVAYASNNGNRQRLRDFGKRTEINFRQNGFPQPEFRENGQDVADTYKQRPQGHGGLRECRGQWLTWQGSKPLKGIWESEPDVGRVAHGVPHRVDRLKGLGNAVVPQQVYPVYKAIMEIEKRV